MPTPVTSAQRPSVAGAILLTAALAVVGAFVAFLSLLLPMASDSCAAGDARPICSASVQVLVAVLPAVGLLVGLAVAVIGAMRAWRRYRPPTRWVGLGWLVFAVAAVAAWVLATAG
ncbi:MAG: hypothetical protein H0W01_02895 [Pseudonocardiales bacterium]|nr:hypothetical protein [Pseudonocardiales bacterium]